MFTRKLKIETLEAKEVLAGNVVASFANDTITITGDDLDNSIRIIDTDDGMRVAGFNGTSVNGTLNGRFNANGLVKKIEVSIKDGNDTINVRTQNLANSLLIDTGNPNSLQIEDGMNQFHVSQSNFNYLRVKGIEGRETLTVNTSDLNEVRFVGGDHSDAAHINRTYIKKRVDLFGGRGSELFSIHKSEIRGHLRAITNGGHDTVRIAYSEVGGTTNVVLGGGNDTGLSYRSNHGGKLKVDGGGGNDTLVKHGADFLSDILVKGGAGNDTILTAAADYHGNIDVFAGAGNDFISADFNLFRGDNTILGEADFDTYNEVFDDKNENLGTVDVITNDFTRVLVDYLAIVNSILDA